jgi:dTDP-glucose pyrophosphorylase
MKDLIIVKNKTIRHAIEKINRNAKRSLVVVDNNKKLLGTISDGDIRRHILSKRSLNDKVFKAFNSNPNYIYEDIKDKKIISNIFLTQAINLLPVVNKNLIVKKILSDSSLSFKNNFKNTYNIPTLIMAGGLGKRLDPFTQILPKPLIPINNKAAIQIIIENFLENGFKRIFISLNYKAELIKSVLKDSGKKFYNKIYFIKEKKPLGTAGSIKLIEKKIKNFLLVSNCDILSELPFDDIINNHVRKKVDMTIVCSLKNYQIDYGVCELSDEGRLARIVEKPSHDLLINIGVYLINKNVIKLIPKNIKYDFTDLIKNCLSKKLKIEIFPISEGLWTDIGDWNKFNKKSSADKII